MVTHPPSGLGDEAIEREIPRPDAADAELSPSVVNELLASERRRYVLYYLLGFDTVVSVDEITEQVAVWEKETPPDDVPADFYERVHVSIVHQHLPKLVDEDAVDYDEGTNLVTMADGMDLLTVELYLAAEREHRER